MTDRLVEAARVYYAARFPSAKSDDTMLAIAAYRELLRQMPSLLNTEVGSPNSKKEFLSLVNFVQDYNPTLPAADINVPELVSEYIAPSNE